MNRRLCLLPILILPLLFATNARATEDSLNIVATSTQAADLIRILSAGVDGVSITALMGAGVSIPTFISRLNPTSSP